jgi:hypothetical protein
MCEFLAGGAVAHQTDLYVGILDVSLTRAGWPAAEVDDFLNTGRLRR